MWLAVLSDCVAAWVWLGTDGDIAAAIPISQSPFCVGVGDGWGYRSSILHNCDIGIAAALLILQLRYRYRSFAFCVCLRAIPPTPPTPKLT